MNKIVKTSLAIVAAVVLLAIPSYCYVKFCFVYSDGVNEGVINYINREGFVFKTYEGKMIQAGYKSKGGSGVQSNEFKFSVEDDAVAKQIEANAGKQVKLHWNRYLGTLPWRGNSQYVVDKLVTAKEPVKTNDLLDMPLEQ